MEFLELLKFSVAGVLPASEGYKTDWAYMHDTASRQSLLGVVFDGIERLPATMKPPREVLLTWFAEVQRIRQTNLKVNKNAARLTEIVREAGFRCCVLKGQGNNLLYPNAYSRMPGDIDIWMKPLKGDAVELCMAFARKHYPDGKINYHHIDAGVFRGTEVEVHFRPSFMNNLVCNNRLQHWFETMSTEQFAHEVELPDGVGRIPVPTQSFNRIYQMVHISNHFFHEGIGLRQLVDYYYVLECGFTDEERLRDTRLMKQFGIYKIATAVMYVLNEVLALPKERMIVPPDECRGRLLLEEIMLAGNFGHYDQRLSGSHTALGRNLQRLKRDLRLVRLFPSECIWEPVFRWFHFFWRLRHT